VAKEFKKAVDGTYSCGYSSGFSPDSLLSLSLNNESRTKSATKLNNNFDYRI
jgi:hypothetical protein